MKAESSEDTEGGIMKEDKGKEDNMIGENERIFLMDRVIKKVRERKIVEGWLEKWTGQETFKKRGRG